MIRMLAIVALLTALLSFAATSVSAAGLRVNRGSGNISWVTDAYWE